ncbi:MAG TPA: sn-glycerol-3-phosphate ABC transporter permease UgpE [Spirochaetia bacterium]|nr:sn-glycerol-3-phosphate ABC transporter permease UgpE [Spirochaetia bacterium]
MRTTPARRVARHALLIFIAIVFAIPLYIAFVAATHSPEALLGAFPLAPGHHFGENIINTLKGAFPNTPPLSSMMVNSLIMALGITVGKLLVSIPAAYAIVFFRFRGRMVAFWAIFVTLLLPVQVRFFPTYEVTSDLGMLNSYQGLIIPLIASATATFLFRQMFMTMPLELSDAARIDGAGPLTFLWKILLPLSRPNLAAISVIEFIYGWNQYLWPLLATSGPRYQTVVVGMQGLISAAAEFAVPRWNLVMAAALLAMAPPVIVMLVMQRWFIKGLTSGVN